MDKRTPTTILLEIMDDFSSAEPEKFLAIWTNAEGDIVFKSNCSKSTALGMAEYAKYWILKEAGL